MSSLLWGGTSDNAPACFTAPEAMVPKDVNSPDLTRYAVPYNLAQTPQNYFDEHDRTSL